MRVSIRRTPRQLEVDVIQEPGSAAPGNGAGPGHGLVGMHERVALYGGRLAAGPGPEGGFEVRAALPVQAARRMSTRVLIADDQSMVRRGFRMIIDAEDDLEVVAEASDGEQAVAACGRFAPDVVLMDIRMPVVDGLEAARRILAAARRHGSSCSRPSTSTTTSSSRCAPAPAASS